jgi:hypothetical protein
MKNVNLFQVIFYAANAAGGLDASGLDFRFDADLDSRFDAGFRVDNFVCVDNSVDNSVNNSVDNSVDNGFDDTVDNSVNDGFDDSVNDCFDRAD